MKHHAVTTSFEGLEGICSCEELLCSRINYLRHRNGYCSNWSSSSSTRSQHMHKKLQQDFQVCSWQGIKTACPKPPWWCSSWDPPATASLWIRKPCNSLQTGFILLLISQISFAILFLIWLTGQICHHLSWHLHWKSIKSTSMELCNTLSHT